MATCHPWSLPVNTAVSILLTVVLVGGGIGAYHVVTSDGAADAGADAIAIQDRDLSGLEARLAAIEGNKPILVGSATPADLYDRIKVLEERLANLEKAPAARVGVGLTEAAPESTVAAAGSEVVDLGDGVVSPLTASQEKRIQDLVRESMRDRQRRGGEDRMNRTLNELGIELTDDQRKRLDKEMGEHRNLVRDLFRSGMAEGKSRDELMTQVQELNQGFTQKISEFIPAADAEALVGNLTSMGGRGGRPGGRGR